MSINTMTAKQGRVIDGDVRTPGKTYSEYRKADPKAGPDDIYAESAKMGGDHTVPNSWYFSEEHANLEKEHIWSKVWIWACREEKIPHVGSCYVHDFLDNSVMIVRVSKTEIKAYRNTCRHRGNQLRPNGSCGVIKKFFCPFHGATWNLDGSVSEWPFEYEFPTVSENDYGLHEVHIGVFEGFVFVNMADDPVPFEEYIDPLPKLLNGISWDNRYPYTHVRKHLRCNWKVGVQAFHEAMHVPFTHPQGRATSDVAGTQNDIFGTYVTRLINPIGVSGDTLDKTLTEKEVLDRMLPPGALDQILEMNPDLPMRARDILAFASAMKVQMETGLDVSDRPTTELIDNVVYHLFPNFQIIHQIGLPVAFKFSPGKTPDDCYFDVMTFKECAPGTEKPQAPEVIEVSAEQTFAERGPQPDPSGFLEVFDQDTDNVEGQQRGLKATPDGHCIFSNYLESLIVHELKLQGEMMGLDK